VIDVRLLELADADAAALLRPVAADWSAVNPAMRRLELVAGEALAEQCERLGELPVGSAVITAAGDLPARFMVHAVVRSAEEPVTRAGVQRALRNGLRRLQEWGIGSVALVPLGTGAGNLDAEEAAQLMIPVLREHMAGGGCPTRVVIAVESDYERTVFERQLAAPAAGGDPASE
jgi:O-acetyl-ADP-ribose deacetylase (regulator of RNase III)